MNEVVFVSWVREPMNTWVVLFDLDWPPIFVGLATYIRRLTDEYKRCHTDRYDPPIFVV
jgi:hypothetical protein